MKLSLRYFLLAWLLLAVVGMPWGCQRSGGLLPIPTDDLTELYLDLRCLRLDDGYVNELRSLSQEASLPLFLDDAESFAVLEIGTTKRGDGLIAKHKEKLGSGENARFSFFDKASKERNLVRVCPTVFLDGSVGLSVTPIADAFFVLDRPLNAVVPQGRSLLIRSDAPVGNDGKLAYLLIQVEVLGRGKTSND